MILFGLCLFRRESIAEVTGRMNLTDPADLGQGRPERGGGVQGQVSGFGADVHRRCAVAAGTLLWPTSSAVPYGLVAE